MPAPGGSHLLAMWALHRVELGENFGAFLAMGQGEAEELHCFSQQY